MTGPLNNAQQQPVVDDSKWPGPPEETFVAQRMKRHASQLNTLSTLLIAAYGVTGAVTGYLIAKSLAIIEPGFMIGLVVGGAIGGAIGGFFIGTVYRFMAELGLCMVEVQRSLQTIAAREQPAAGANPPAAQSLTPPQHPGGSAPGGNQSIPGV